MQGKDFDGVLSEGQAGERAMRAIQENEVDALERRFEKELKLNEDDIVKLASVRVNLRGIGLLMIDESEYQRFLDQAKVLIEYTDLQTLNQILIYLLGNKNFSSYYADIVGELVKADFGKKTEDKSKSVKALTERILEADSHDAAEVLAKAELGAKYGLNFVDEFENRVDEHKTDFMKLFNGVLTRSQYVSWLKKISKFGDTDFLDEITTYIINQFSIFGENPLVACQNVEETIAIATSMNEKDARKFLIDINSAEGAYADVAQETPKKPLSKDLN
ncbi:hypothetical protein IT411_02970 [Candidatus Peregrinibacteria bacterium]|nr:hypothetical protein [Candidatus Peregrinibacteria bacterium]